MKYLSILLLVCCLSIDAQAQCPSPCNVPGYPPPPNSPYFTIDTLTSYTFYGSCGAASTDCEAPPGSCDDTCATFAIRWHGCCTLDSIEFNFEGCVKVCAEVFKPTHPSWQNDNSTECKSGVHKFKPTFSTDVLSTCDVLVIRVCGPSGTLRKKGFSVAGLDCNGNPVAAHGFLLDM
jgi:hypothetical protein